ncbi:O-antigen ligase family protein [Pyrinomonas methylaliphatogenes]|uniref:Lipid A core-O-antigen ligase-like enyme n=1 Tax=Pyrinomonas methylaliphatogenes TaxID=454194 RepID=A0A0B6WV56_9BACT|nr:O-antigen ligase family protein [Pyrinomonas methylaliphatogenes]CDM65173.1 lipid A core-O-antigen ligase-like enyme [Pyrinomonas methylaliphatogenes]
MFRLARDGEWPTGKRAIFWGALGLILFASIPYGTVGTWWEAAFECAAFALGLLWLIEGYVRGTWRLRGMDLLLPLVGGVVLACVQCFTGRSADPYGTWLIFLKLAALTLVFASLLACMDSLGRLRLAIHFIIALGVGTALFGIARQVAQHQAQGFLLPLLKPDVGYAQFINRDHFAFLMEMVFGLLLGLLFGRAMAPHRMLVYLAAALLVWASLVFSNSRGGIIISFLQLSSALVIRDRLGAPIKGRAFFGRVLLAVSLLAVMMIGVVWLGGERLLVRLESEPLARELGDGVDKVRRLGIWRATCELIADHPLLGVGFGGYWTAIPRYYRYSGEWELYQAHNDYLELLASGGVVGALLGVWFFAALVRRARIAFASSDRFRRAVCFGASLGIFGALIHSAVDYGLHITINALVFLLLATIVAVEIDSPSERWHGKCTEELSLVSSS